MSYASAAETSIEEKDDGNEDLHRKILKCIKDSRRHYSDWREEAKECYDFYAGHQWAQEDIDILNAQGRPPVVFNRTARTINSVTGLEVQNRQEVNYFPRQLGNAGKSEVLTGAVKWSRDECDAEDEESEAFEDTIISGMGWTETRLDYETDAEGVILIERFDPLEGIVDYTAKKRNCEDSRYRGRIKTYSVEEFKERFPDKDVPKGKFFDAEEEDKQVQDLSPGGYSPDNQDTQSSVKEVQVCQWQYYEIQKVRMVQDAGGKMVEMPEAQFNERRGVMDAAGMQYTKQSMPKRVYKQCFLSANEILEDGDCPVNDFTLKVITGLRDRNTNTWFGLVRPMKDPQRWANKWLSQIQHILNTQAKSGKLLWETGAFKNPRKAKEEWSSPDAMAELNAGGLAKIEQIQPAQYPQGVDRLLQYALEAINDVPGVNLELMGLANRDQANVLEQSRKQAGVTILAKFFDSLRRYRKKQGRIHAEFVQQYISDGRLIRITGELGPQYVKLIRDPDMLKYDVVVDDAPTSTNMKEKTFTALQTILPMVLQEKIPVPPDLLDYLPVPEDLIQKWKQYIQQQSQNPEVQQQKQLMMAGQQADVQSKQADAQAKNSKSKLDDINAIKVLHEMQNPQGQAPVLDPMMELHSKEQIEMAKIASKERMEALKIAANMQSQIETARITASSVAAGHAQSEHTKQNDNQTAGNIAKIGEQALNTLAEAMQSIGEGNKLISEALLAPKDVTVSREGNNLVGQLKPRLN